MLLALLVYRYCLGVLSPARSSGPAAPTRLPGDLRQPDPDHSTICRLGADHEAAVAGVLCDVLVLCAQAGLLQVGIVAIDGSKMAAAASRKANRTLELYTHRHGNRP